MLTDTITYKIFRGLPLTDLSLDGMIGSIIPAVDLQIKQYCKQGLENQTIIEEQDGSNMAEMVCRQGPVHLESLSGTLTAGSTAVTSLTTTNLAPGLGVAVVGQSGPSLSAGTILATVGSGSATLSAPALVSGTVNMIFGPSVAFDMTAYDGQSNSAFGAGAVLTLGLDYELKRDMPAGLGLPAGYSKSGILRRTGWGPVGMLANWPYRGMSFQTGGLTARRMPVWQNWYGNIRITYIAGWGVGPVNGQGATLPGDLMLAANMQVSWFIRNAQAGAAVLNEVRGKVTTTVEGAPVAGQAPIFGTVKQILSRYRVASI